MDLGIAYQNIYNIPGLILQLVLKQLNFSKHYFPNSKDEFDITDYSIFVEDNRNNAQKLFFYNRYGPLDAKKYISLYHRLDVNSMINLYVTLTDNAYKVESSIKEFSNSDWRKYPIAFDQSTFAKDAEE